MNYKNILFDLDGTLTDPYEGITNSAKYALGKFNISEDAAGDLSRIIGPPLELSFREFFHLNGENVKKAVAYYREYYTVKGIYENKLYDGMEALLQELRRRGLHCFTATSKPEKFAGIVLRHFKIDRYFDGVVGSNMDGSRSDKGDVIAYTLEKYHLKKEETIMIGDTKYDAIGARKNGIDILAVTYGYGSVGELKAAGTAYMCNTVMGILEILVPETLL
jgi:phosphoglycolate phosphatase